MVLLDRPLPRGSRQPFDVVVLGGGPAGVTAALRGRELGASVALVERGSLGGTCTNDGCVPTRVLAKAARLVRDAEQFADHGLAGEPPSVDFVELLDRTQRIVYRVHEKKQLHGHLEGSGVEVFEEAGEVRFSDPHTVRLGDGRTIGGQRIVICAGGHARRLAFPGSDLALTHSDIWRLRSLPRSVAIVGAAATGCQLASIFAAFGSAVTILDVAPRLLPAEDDAISHALAAAFTRRGIDVRPGIAGVRSIEREERRDGDPLVVRFGTRDREEAVRVEAVVLAVGWPGNVDGLGLEAVGVRTERGYVAVDDELRTSESHIYAAGDITGRMMLVQSATHEARVAAENAVTGPRRTLRHAIVPHGGFTDPEYGSVGLTEILARAAEDVVVATVPYADLDRAVIDGQREGVCKLIASRATGQLLGVHVLGEQAVEVVQIVAAGMAAGMSVRALAELELAYPTFTSIVGLAARRIVRRLEAGEPAAEWQSLEPGVEWESRYLDEADRAPSAASVPPTA